MGPIGEPEETLLCGRRFEFEKRRQLFVDADDEPFFVVAVRVYNEDRSPVGINRCDTAPTPPGFTEIDGAVLSKHDKSKQHVTAQIERAGPRGE
jgi:hypothetical protein